MPNLTENVLPRKLLPPPVEVALPQDMGLPATVSSPPPPEAHAAFEQTAVNPESPAASFHQWYIENPNIKTMDMPRWWLEDKAAKHLEQYPTWRALSQQNPNFYSSDYYRYKVNELVDAATTPTTAEQVQQKAEEFAPPVLASVGSLAGPIGTGVGAFVGSLIPQLRHLTTGAQNPAITETLNDAAVNTALGGLGDVALQRGLINPIASSIRRTFVPQANEPGRQLGLAALESQGAVPSLTQRGGGATSQFLEAVTENSIGGRGFAATRQLGVEQAAEDLALRTLQVLRPVVRGDDAAGLAWASEAKNLRSVYEEAGRRRYEVVDRLTKGGAPVDTRLPIRLTSSGPVTDKLFSQFVVPERIDYATGKQLSPGFEGLGGNPKQPPGFLDMMHNGNFGAYSTNFEMAQRARSAMLDINRAYKYPADNIEKQAGALAGSIARSLDERMIDAAKKYEQTQITSFINKGMTPQQARLAVEPFANNYQQAQAFWRRNIGERFENEMYKTLAEDVASQPGKFVRFALKADSVDQLRIIRRAAPREWDNVRGQIVTNIIQDAVSTKGGGIGEPVDALLAQGLVKKVDGTKLVSKFQNLGPEYTNYLLGHDGKLALQKLGAALDIVPEKAQSPGRFWIVLTQTGALGGVLGGAWYAKGPQAFTDPNTLLGASGVLVTPAILSYMLTHQYPLRLLTAGLIGGPKTSAGAKLLAFTTARMWQDSLDESRKMEDLQRKLSVPSLPTPIEPQLQQAPPPPLSNLPRSAPPPMLRNLPPVGQPPF